VSRTPCVVVAGESSEGRQLIAGMLSGEPWHIVGAPDGETVVELVHGRTADLLLIDTHLRDRNGLDVCRRLRHEVDSRLFPIVVISNQDDISSRVAALEAGADDFLSRPLERNELIARVRSLLHLKSIQDRLEDARQVIFALANAAEAKDLFTQEHTGRVADSASKLARRLELSSATIEQIRTGALIHDVGKLAIPDHILNKPGPLTESEFALVRTHTLVGAEIVAPLTSQRALVAIVRNHHERFDGGGYPDRLRGEAIPLAARIVAVCDAFDAMTNQRPYRPAMPYPRALSILKAGRGRQWDAALVDAFVTILEQR
jgi:putative two-component system response regulator